MTWCVCHSISFWSTALVTGLMGICPEMKRISPTAVTGE